MQDIEIDSLLADAGYQFDAPTGRYRPLDSAEGDEDYPTEDVADQLEIPIDDLIRWEEQFGQPDGQDS